MNVTNADIASVKVYQAAIEELIRKHHREVYLLNTVRELEARIRELEAEIEILSDYDDKPD